MDKKELNKELDVDLEAVADNATASGDSEENEEESLVIKLKKPYTFEGKVYEEINLECLEELNGSDLIAINNRMKRLHPGVDVMPEVSAEFAMYYAARGTKLPVEFFKGLPAYAVMAVKNKVLGFLFG